MYGHSAPIGASFSALAASVAQRVLPVGRMNDKKMAKEQEEK